jgi:aspartate racemase
MKTIGLLGGMSWESTASYYQSINQLVKDQLGGLHSARILLNSLDFAQIEALQNLGDWDHAAEMLITAARQVEAGGADCLLICTNTMHKVAPQVAEAIQIPLVHIADATAEVLQKDGVQTVGLLGTAFTMEEDFYKRRLSEQFGLNVIVPEEADRALVHQVIYEELCLGVVDVGSRAKYLNIIDQLVERGAEAVILGCTEIAMLVKPEHTKIKLFDTTAIHAEKAVAFALEPSKYND